MYATLLTHQWKKTVRSKYFSQGWGGKILLGFMVLYFGGLFLALGIFLPELLREVYPSAPLITPLFSRFILYYILVDLAIRFFLQDLNVLSVRHYLLHPIPKSKIINFLLGSSIFNFFNALPLLLIIPFAIRGVAPESSALTAVVWLTSMLMLVLFDHFLAIYIKRVIAIKQAVFFVFAGVVALLLIGNALAWFSLQDFSSLIFQNLGALWFLLIPLALMATLYVVNFRFLLAQSYLDKWTSHEKEVGTQRFGFIESRGVIGAMIANELKLIFRNRRPRGLLVMGLIFSLYGLMFYLNPQYEGHWVIFVFVGIFMTGIFMISYGQLLIGWEGAYFDGILTRSYSIKEFFQGKFWLLATSCVILYILSLGYLYFGWRVFWIHTACFFYNIGVNSFILLFASTYHKKKIDLTRGSAFNHQGSSITQFVVAIPLIGLPLIIFQGFNVLGKPYLGLLALALLGLISLAFSKYWFAEIIKNFKEKKYQTAKGFRE